MSFDRIYTLLARCIVLVGVIPVHECAHGWMAEKLGDPTARNSGRLTLNPLRHFDPIGSALMLLTGFGWAKAVPVNPRYFKNPRQGMALTALAGPAANLLFGFVLLLLYRVFGGVVVGTPLYLTSAPFQIFTYAVLEIVWSMMLINLSLAVFNLIPVPPLDGSRIVALLLPARWYFKIMEYERYIFVAMAVLLFTGVFSRPLNVAVQYLLWVMVRLTDFVDLFL